MPSRNEKGRPHHEAGPEETNVQQNDTHPLTFDQVALALEARGGRRQHDGSLRGPCPAHGGDNASALRLAEGNDGQPLVHCFARGCDWREILDALGFDVSRRTWTPQPPSPERRFRTRFEEWQSTTFRRLVRERDQLRERAAWLATVALHRLGEQTDIDETLHELAATYDRESLLEQWLEVLSQGDWRERLDLYAQEADRGR
jgi:hypothetical protein